MSFPRYPAYKDSGVEWLGSIPLHWDVQRLKSLFTLMRREPREEDGIVTAFRDGEVTLRANRRVDGFTNAVHEIGYQGIRTGDLVIHAMDAFAGAIGVSDSDGKSTPVYSVCTPKGPWVDSWYYGLTLRHMALSGFVNSLAKGIRERSTEFRWADASVVALPVPPIEEQVVIKEFLDHETAKIDALVAEQERLIELLKEKRQAVISHAVTKGLDSSVPMKDSGVEWLGEVPAHWESWKVAHAFGSIGSGTTPPSNEEHWYDNGTIPWVTTGELRENVIFETSKSVTSDALQKFSALRLHPVGSLVVAMYGATIGRLGILGVNATTNQACCVLGDPKHLDIAFTFYWLQGFKQIIIDLFSSGGGQPNINQDIVSGLRIPAPGLPEQKMIITFLDQETAKIDALVIEALSVITLLQERRTALISAAVTGQIDVRGFACEKETA